jgi:hypothetical protein
VSPEGPAPDYSAQKIPGRIAHSFASAGGFYHLQPRFFQASAVVAGGVADGGVENGREKD